MSPTTKQKLLLAALNVFAEKGYRGATVREIAQLAGAANLNAVSYYFGSKEGLYRAALEHVFQDSEQKWQYQPPLGVSAEDELRAHVRATCHMVYGEESEVDAWRAAIFIHEMAYPSPFLDEMVERFMLAGHQEFHALVGRLLGQGAPKDLVRDCAQSVMGQILYYLFCWPLLTRFTPGHPGMKQHLEHVAEHVARFSLAGIAAAKEHWEQSKAEGRE